MEIGERKYTVFFTGKITEMRDHKLLNLLQKLSREELRGFRSYLTKMYPRQNIVLSIFDFLKKYHPNFDSNKLDRKKAFPKIFVAEVYKEKKLFNGLSDLRKYLKEYLLFDFLQKESFEKDFLLLELAKERQLDELFSSSLLKLEKQLTENPTVDVWHWLKKMRLAHIDYFNPATERVSNEASRIHDAMLHLDQFYAAAKLRYACELYSRHKIIKEPLPEIDLLDEIITHNTLNDSPFHQAYLLALQLIKDRSDKLYVELKPLLLDEQSEIHFPDRQVLLTYLINHIAHQIRRGDQNAVRDAFELYSESVEQGLFIKDGHFDKSHFFNIVAVAVKLEEFGWVEKFLDRWSPRLEADSQESILEHCKALLAFEKKDYGECIELLRTLESQNVYHEIRIRWLRIAAHVEIKENFDLIDSLCRAYQQYIRRNNTMHEAVQESILIFIRIVRKLISVNPNREALQKILEEAKYNYYKSWLLKKINQLGD